MQCESLWVRSAFVLILVIGGCSEIPRRTDAQWGTDYNAAVQSMTAPLLVNETGSCLSVVAADDIRNELNWWDAMVHASVDLGIGVTAYYWMSDSDLGPVFAGESLVTGDWPAGAASPAPNKIGEIFIKYAP